MIEQLNCRLGGSDGYYEMIEGRVKPIRNDFVRYLGQLLLMYPLTLVSSIPVFWAFSHFGLDGDLGHGITFAGFGALICFYVGALLGYILALQMPSLIATGYWIWIPPTVLIFFDFPTLLRSGFAPRFLDYLYATGDNEGLGVFLVTLPSSALIGYSLGVFLAKFRAGRSQKRHHTYASVVWIAAFAITSSLMVRVERTLVSSHRRLAVAVRIDGTPFVSDPTGLCGPVGAGNTSKGVMLQSPTKLELLDHNDCSAFALGIDRVRVIDGPNRGSEGWVITSQVWRPLALP